MARAKLSPPWVAYVRELEELFKFDPEVHVVYEDEDEHVAKLYVDDNMKASALNLLLPDEKEFGKVKLIIEVIPANGFCDVPTKNLMHAAFDGNDAVSFIYTVDSVPLNGSIYVVFENRVVQYFNDDIGDIYGQCSTLYQDIAKDVFGDIADGVHFCTDLPIKSSNGNVTDDMRRMSWP